MSEETDPFERALARTEADIVSALRAAGAHTRELKKAQKCAAAGSIRELERALEAADDLGGSLREGVRMAKGGWSFDVRQHFESGGYTRELLARAQAAGLVLQEQDDRIVAFPSLARLVPAESAIDVNKKRERSIRPSAVVERFRAARDQPVRFKPEPFLEALLQAYRFVLGEEKREGGSTVKLLDIYRVLTVLPGSAPSYPKPEFARDIYLLEESGVRRTREGLEVVWPAAAGTRGTQTLGTVTRDGRLRVYYGIAFEQ